MNMEATAATKIEIKRVEKSSAIEIAKALKINKACLMTGRTPSSDTPYIHDVIYFSAYRADKCAGMIAISASAVDNLHIEFLAIAGADQLRSVGQRLLLVAEDFCYSGGYSSLSVESVIAKGAVATHESVFHDFYRQYGYKMLFELSSDSAQKRILMQKILNLNDFTFVDLTHTLSPTVPHWGLDVGFKYNARNIQTAETAGGLKFRVQRLEMSAGIGTHLDAPSHCFEQAAAIDTIPIQSLISACRVIDVSAKVNDTYSVSVDDILAFEDHYGMIPKGAFIIIYTGWDQRWSQPEKYRNEKIFPNISIEAAKLLVARDIVGVGIDTLSPDAFGSNFPVHELLLGNGKYIIENVANAKQLDPTGCFVFALPIKIVDGTEAPIRLVGMKRKPAMM